MGLFAVNAHRWPYGCWKMLCMMYADSLPPLGVSEKFHTGCKQGLGVHGLVCGTLEWRWTFG
jgi:hypothetical protein